MTQLALLLVSVTWAYAAANPIDATTTNTQEVVQPSTDVSDVSCPSTRADSSGAERGKRKRSPSLESDSIEAKRSGGKGKGKRKGKDKGKKDKGKEDKDNKIGKDKDDKKDKGKKEKGKKDKDDKKDKGKEDKDDKKDKGKKEKGKKDTGKKGKDQGNSNDKAKRYFASGREYIYRYEGQVVSGIPKVTKEVSGIKIVADTRIQMKADNKCLLKLEDVKLFKMQNKTEDPAKQQPKDRLQRLQEEVERPIIEQLQKTAEFRYVNGKVFDIVMSEDQPIWASNIIKGVMELMLVNICGTDDLNEPVSQHTRPTSIHSQKEHYRVLEKGIAGECESVYNVKVSEPLPSIIDKQVQLWRFALNITKTRDLLGCQLRTQRSEVSILSGKKCDKCQEKEDKDDLLKSLSQVRYSISLRSHTKFLIDKVVAEGQHIFMPFGEKGGRAVTFVNQTFVLKSNNETSQDNVIPEVQNPKEPEDLKFVFKEWKGHEHDADEEQELTADDDLHVTAIRNKVEAYIQNIYDNVQNDRINEEAPLNFTLLVKMLKKLSPLELTNVFDRLGNRLDNDDEETSEKKKILLDAILQVENDKSVEILMNRIESRNFEGEEANQILSTIALINNATEEIVDKVLALCKGPVFENGNVDRQLRKTCWLSFGSLVHKACKINKVCSENKIQEYSMNLLAGIDSTCTEEDKRMCLKAIGNAGLVLRRSPDSNTDSIKEIAEIIKGTADHDLRLQAIYSLRRVAKTVPERVIPLLMPLVKDQTEDHEIRIAAYVIVMDSEPEGDVVRSIVSNLHKDKSRQVASFVYSHLESLVANQPDCKSNLTEVAKKALLMLEPVVKGAQYSKRFMWAPSFFEKKVSLYTEASVIGTPMSPFPVSGAAKLGATIFNRQMNIMEVGFHARSLRNIAEKILGVARPVRKTQKMLRMLDGQLPEEKSLAQRDLDALDGKLPTTEIRSDPLEKTSGYLKFFGNELRTFEVDKPTIWSYLEGTSERMVEIEDKMRSGTNPFTFRRIFSLGSGVHEIPTEIGLPLTLSVGSAAVMSLNVKGKAEVTPPLTEVLSNRETKLENVDVEGVVKPSAAVAIKGKMKVSLDNVYAGLCLTGSLNTSVILNGSVHVDVAKRLYNTSFSTPAGEHQAFSLRSRPYTFTYIKNVEPQGAEVGVFKKKLIKGELMSPKPIKNTWSIGRESLGVELELKTRRVPRTCPYRYAPTQLIFNGPLDVSIAARPGVDAPSGVLAQMKLTDVNMSQEEYKEFKHKYLINQYFRTLSSSVEEEDMRAYFAAQDRIPPYVWAAARGESKATMEADGLYVPDSDPPDFRTWGIDLFKELEDWKYDTGKWPFSQEEEDTLHDNTQRVAPDPTETVKLLHIFFNISTQGSQPIRELISRISLDQQDVFYKALRFDAVTGKKTYVPDFILMGQYREQIDQTQVKTLCMQGELEHPAYAATLPESKKLTPIPGLPDVPLDPKVLFRLATQWGRSCEVDKKMEIKARVQRSDKQKEELQMDTPDKEKCLRNIEEGNKYTQACRALRREREELRSVHVELTHNEHVQKTYKSMFYQGLEIIKGLFWNNMEMAKAEVHNPDKTVLLTGELEKTNMKMNLSIKHTRNNVKFNQVVIPKIVQDLEILQPYKLEQHMVMSYAEEPLSGRNINKCKALRNDSFITFDKVIFNYQQSMCDHILAKDCSDKERFVVLTRKLTQSDTKKIITVYVDDTKIQFKPSLLSEEIQTLINDSDAQLPVQHKIIIRDDLTEVVPIDEPKIHIMDLETPEKPDPKPWTVWAQKWKRKWPWDVPESAESEEDEIPHDEQEFWSKFKQYVRNNITADPQNLPQLPKTQVQIIRTKLGDSIMLFAPEQELKVFFDGHNTKVELPQKYKGMQCGLCGDFNGEISDEFVGPNREVYKNAQRFGRSYQVSTQNCTEVEQCTPVMEFPYETKVSLPGDKKQYYDCISKAPVPHCPHACRRIPSQVEPVDVDFTCIGHKDTSSPFIWKRRDNIMNVYSTKKADYKLTMNMATECVGQ